MEYKQVTSKKSKVKLGSGQSATDIFIATKTTQTTRKNSNGTPIYTKEIIRYPSATSSESEGVVIATGSTEEGASKLSPTTNATTIERRNLSSNINNASKNQITSVQNQLDDSAEAKKALADLGGTDRNPNPEEQTGDFSSSDFGKIKKRTDTKTEGFGTWKYPSDLAANQDVIRFTMLKYEPRSFEASQSKGFSFANRLDTTKRSIGNVTLPIPAGIRDQNIVDWNQKDLNPFEIAAAGIAKDGIEKGMKGALGQMSKTFNKLQGGENNADAQAVASNLIAGAATGIGQQLLTRATGAIINPNMELLFSGPSLRPFNFTFKLSARNKTEADQIIGIIRFFKRGMAAQRSESELFLKSPHTFKLQYLLRGKEDHPYIGQIKECALKSFSVNYTPENNYATYESGLMVSYEITMDLQELEPVFNDEYENIPGIGY